MEKKTVGMIRFIKHHGGEYPTLRHAAIAYMMTYSGCPEEIYTKDVIESIIFEVFCDFIDAVDKPSMHLRVMAESSRFASYMKNSNKNIYDYMLTAMHLVQVRDDNGYINGFKKEDFDQGVDFN